MASLPSEKGVVDEILDALVDLLTEKCQTDVDAADAARATMIKAGPRQANPDGVHLLLHENDDMDPKGWAHRPLKYKVPRALRGNMRTEMDAPDLRVSSGYVLIGGGSQMARAFTLELEVFGNFITGLTSVEREDVRLIASVVENRAVKAMLEAGAQIGTGALVSDDFGESVTDGPFLGSTWTDQEEGEALIVRKMIRLWYRTSKNWSL